MASKVCTSNPEAACSCGGTHKGHICWLSHMELFNEVFHLSSNPTVSCSKCGAKANLAQNVCVPVALGNATNKNYQGSQSEGWVK